MQLFPPRQNPSKLGSAPGLSKSKEIFHKMLQVMGFLKCDMDVFVFFFPCHYLTFDCFQITDQRSKGSFDIMGNTGH